MKKNLSDLQEKVEEGFFFSSMMEIIDSKYSSERREGCARLRTHGHPRRCFAHINHSIISSMGLYDIQKSK